MEIDSVAPREAVQPRRQESAETSKAEEQPENSAQASSAQEEAAETSSRRESLAVA